MSPASTLKDEPETPRELVEDVMNDNPTAGIERIKAIVRAKIGCPEADDWLRSFVDETTERHAQSILREVREKHAPKGSDKFTSGVASSSISSAIGLGPEGKPYVRVGTERLDIPPHKSAEEIAQLAIARQKHEREIREKHERSNSAFHDAVKECTQHMMKMSLLIMIMPNGKMLRDCTYAECGQFSGWFKSIAMQGRPDNELVGKRMTEDALRKIQTWND